MAAEGDVMSPKNLDNGADAKLLSPNEIPEAVARHLYKHDHVRYKRLILCVRCEQFRKWNELSDVII